MPTISRVAGRLRAAFWMALMTGLGGCVLAPRETKQEQFKLNAASRPFEAPIEARQLPELPEPADWRDALHRAFLANGELESAYFEWKAAMARIDQAAAWPNSNVAVSYSYMFSSGNMKAWDRSTIGVGFDPSMNLQLPVKAKQAGKVALQDARAAGFRFAAMKFDLQRRVLMGWLDLALADENLRIQQTNVQLLSQLSQTAQARVQAGGPQQDLLKIQIQYRLAENELENLAAQVRSQRAMLNGMLARDALAPLTLPPALPAPRPVAADDARLIAVAVEQNPELATLAAQVAGRRDAVELARLRYIPDFNPQAAFTGSISQSVGAMAMLPTNLPAIRGAINEAQAMLRSVEAVSRQAKRDKAAAFVAALVLMRNAERQVELYQQRILPLAEQALNSSRQAYTTGTVAFADLIDSQRTLLDVRLTLAQLRIERERQLTELETLAGVDVETLAQPTTAPTTRASQPATQPAQTQPAF